MIIDMHFHTREFSSCSNIPLIKGLIRAAEIGLNGVCLTEHDVFNDTPDIKKIAAGYGLKIFIGTEIYTMEGDILCFGLKKLPNESLSAVNLVKNIQRIGGASIAAHPFRNNNRGIKNLISALPGLTAVEAFNGNTSNDNNLLSLEIARKMNIPVIGASDAHSIDRIGVFATEFPNTISSLRELINALSGGNYQPVAYSGRQGYFEKLL